MLKKVLLLVAVVLFVSTSAFAHIFTAVPPVGSIHQEQGFFVADPLNPFNAGLSSIANLYHGASTSSVGQVVTITNTHSASSPAYCPMGPCTLCCTDTGTQTQTGLLVQSAVATGSCSVMTVSAFLDAYGSQDQYVGSAVGMKDQAQGLGVVAQQAILESDGAGTGISTNTAALAQTQVGSNAAGAATEASGIGLSQISTVTGAATSSPSTLSSAIVNTTQCQTVF